MEIDFARLQDNFNPARAVRSQKVFD